MAEGFPAAGQSGVVENRIVQSVFGRPHRGGFCTRTGGVADMKFWMHYTDGTIEQIDPPGGFPRPDPDTAVRTIGQKLPGSFQNGFFDEIKWGSLFSGRMREVVQCDYSRGAETKFSHDWPITHGILEFPYPHVPAGTAADEKIQRGKSRWFVIEISSIGVYAAEVKFGVTDLDCARVDQYLATPASTKISLDAYWRGRQHQQDGVVQKVMTSQQIAPAYSHGIPFYSACGWAFSQSGTKAANVVQDLKTPGPQGPQDDYFETTLVSLAFSVALTGGVDIVSITRSGSVATCNAPGHGKINGDTVTIYGADQGEYNGIHILSNCNASSFDFNISGDPASPATGDSIGFGASDAPVRVSAALTVGDPGKVIFFRNGGTLWIPEGINSSLWNAIPPVNDSLVDGSGPVHVFYDGEEQILTTWSCARANTPEIHIPAGGGEITSVPYTDGNCCENTYSQIGPVTPEIFSNYSPTRTHGFTMNSEPFVGETSNTSGFTRSRSEIATYDVEQPFGNHYGLCEPCWFEVDGTIVTECSAGFVDTATITIGESRQENYATQVSHLSAAILFPTDREAIGIVFGDTNHTASSFSTSNSAGVKRSVVEQVAVGVIPCPWSTVTKDFNGIGGGNPADPDAFPPTSGSSDNSSETSGYKIRASGDYVNEGAIDDAWSPFTFFNAQTHVQAESTLLLMRGGLYYPDPTVSPPAQLNNRIVRSNATDFTVTGGFVDIATRFFLGFVGKV
jgi:hypothetical protein